jgi:hypothetical protein
MDFTKAPQRLSVDVFDLFQHIEIWYRFEVRGWGAVVVEDSWQGMVLQLAVGFPYHSAP